MLSVLSVLFVCIFFVYIAICTLTACDVARVSSYAGTVQVSMYMEEIVEWLYYTATLFYNAYDVYGMFNYM